ncbi:hypothetical protein BS47DRAFT_1339174 [Hydnum rufescens UP504]|uniref:Uncharacterized protein n=1 Tax=Hydnum rufescens UP504 TaxID=1448309 RepID=A0A9P6B541_9AGAM|nr:hypothetical protein BS47DRAFT_1339174 [Hydnum rufescens UP504]
MSAKIHTQASNRASKGKAALRASGQDDRKIVFKNVLDNPLTLDWPHIPLNVQNNILAALIELIAQSDISSFHRQRERKSRKKKAKKAVDITASQSALPVSEPTYVVRRKRKAPEEDPLDHDTSPSKKRKQMDGNAAAIGHPVDSPIPPPELLSHLTFGINQVTKRLEAQTLAYRHSKIPASQSATKAKHLSPIHLVFVCRHDVNPPSLYAHLPMLVAVCNASRPSSAPISSSHSHSEQINQKDPDILLITLPKGAEHALAESIALRRTAVVALDASTPNNSRLLSFLSSIPILQAPWLIPPVGPIAAQSPSGSLHAAVTESPTAPEQSHHQPLIPTRIKHLRTTAPADMRLAKERRTQARADVKAAKLAKAKPQKPTTPAAMSMGRAKKGPGRLVGPRARVPDSNRRKTRVRPLGNGRAKRKEKATVEAR